MLSSLTLVTFLSPPDQGEKISLGISILLSFSVFMLSISENLPKTSETLSLFGAFICWDTSDSRAQPPTCSVEGCYVFLMRTTKHDSGILKVGLHTHCFNGAILCCAVARYCYGNSVLPFCFLCLKHSGIVSKRLKMSSTFCRHYNIFGNSSTLWIWDGITFREGVRLYVGSGAR